MAVFGFNDRSIAEELRDKVIASRSSFPKGDSSPPINARISVVMGFHAIDGIPAATINAAAPTSSEYFSELCDVYYLQWSDSDSSHKPVARVNMADETVQAWVINATSTEIQENEMLWGLSCVGTRDGVPVFMALVGDCG